MGIGRPGGGERGAAKEREADHDRRPAANAVADKAQRHRPYRHADNPGGQDRRQCTGRQLERRENGGPGEGDSLRIEAIEQRNQHAEREDTPLERAKPLLVDKRRNRPDGGVSHDESLQTARVPKRREIYHSERSLKDRAGTFALSNTE